MRHVPDSGSPGAIRSGFTAVELAMVLAVALAVVGAGSSAMLPSLRKAALNESLATVEEACRTARQLAISGRALSSDYYGVVLYRESGQTWVAVSHGPSPDQTQLALDPAGQPRYRSALVGSIGFFTGSDHASAQVLAEGEVVGWLYHHRTGYLTADNALNVTPTFVGLEASELTDAGIIGGRTLLGALSLRTFDQRYARAISIYASGIMSAAELEP